MTPVHTFGDMIREWMLAIPLPVVRGLFVATLLSVLLWVLLLPTSVTQPPGGARRWDENLKYAASLALILQIIVYSLL